MVAKVGKEGSAAFVKENNKQMDKVVKIYKNVMPNLHTIEDSAENGKATLLANKLLEQVEMQKYRVSIMKPETKIAETAFKPVSSSTIKKAQQAYKAAAEKAPKPARPKPSLKADDLMDL